MRRFIAPAALLAVVVLAGCAPEAQTTADACKSVTSSWDQFETFAQSPGRDDGEMVAKRSAMLDTWDTALKDAPQWTATAVGLARDTMAKFAAGGITTSDAAGLYSMASSQIELFREQCKADGNL